MKGDSGGNVNILGGYGVGHWEKKIHMNMRLFLNAFRDGAVWFYKYKSVANSNNEGEMIYW